MRPYFYGAARCYQNHINLRRLGIMQQRLRRWSVFHAVLAVYIMGTVSAFGEVEWVHCKATNRSGELEFLE